MLQLVARVVTEAQSCAEEAGPAGSPGSGRRRPDVLTSSEIQQVHRQLAQNRSMPTLNFRKPGPRKGTGGAVSHLAASPTCHMHGPMPVHVQNGTLRAAKYGQPHFCWGLARLWVFETCAATCRRGQRHAQAVKKVLPGEPGRLLRPYLPAETKLARHLDKQSLRGYKRSRTSEPSSER